MKFVDESGLEARFPYLDNITICGKDQEDHDANFKQFLEAAKCKNLCYNTEKCISQPGVSPSLDISSTRVPYGQILIVYDPFANSPFHTTQGP